MTKHLLTPLSPDDAMGRPTINTGVAMLGRGGDDYVCAHCGRVVIQDFNMNATEPTMVYVCGSCGGLNGAPAKG
jgi:DNA-directed RNA polymerase subunit RPC12/RpoP